MCWSWTGVWHVGLCSRVGRQRDVFWHLERRTRARIRGDSRKSPALESSGAFSHPVLVTAVHACMQNLYLCLHLLDCPSHHTSLPPQTFAVHKTTLTPVQTHTHTYIYTTPQQLICQDSSNPCMCQSRRASTVSRSSLIACAMPFYPLRSLSPCLSLVSIGLMTLLTIIHHVLMKYYISINMIVVTATTFYHYFFYHFKYRCCSAVYLVEQRKKMYE